MRPPVPRTIILFALTCAAFVLVCQAQTPQATPQAQRCTISFPLPNPSDIGTAKFEKLLYDFLDQRCYQNWVADRQIRNSGPFINNQSFGTHNSVKVFYSPKVWSWLKEKNREGEIPDGEMIVKEMFPSPARQDAKLSAWTVMVKDKKGAYDGWYWSFHAPNYAADNPAIDYPDSGFGLYCLRCHASAEKESTFITAKNVEGDPISFAIKVPTMSKQPPVGKDEHQQVAETKEIRGGPFGTARKTPEPNFIALFRGLPLVPSAEVKKFPGESFDHVVPDVGGPKGFVTSSQCLGCHSASTENMAFLFEDKVQPPLNFSPYTEWRASMMGLAGRDPIFHAQLESEKTMRPAQTGFFDNTCYRCHGVMGQRQVELDKHQPFLHAMVYALPGDADAKYGALARDGISCDACHRIAKEELGQPSTFTGQFKIDPPNVVNGPYDQLVTVPMKNAMGITPRFAEQIKTSALCGSCHTVVLPVLDQQGKPVLDKNGKPKEFYEQTTYPEWTNSVYQNERAPVDHATARTCQDCHMPTKFLDRPLVFRVANIEDIDYPFTDFRAPDKDITVRVRDQYSRHTLLGINQFGLMMFEQFPEILGIRTADYMYAEGVPGLLTAQSSGFDLARRETATITVPELSRNDKAIEAKVEVRNLAGHSLPSGVAFRRAFITFEALDRSGRVVWASGRTNNVGAIVNGTGAEILPSEFFYDPATRKQVLQPHYQTISDEGQVQIYEEIIADSQGKITTSFVGLDKVLKSNRLLPKGWRSNGPFAEHTRPHGEAENDPDYVNSNGAIGGDRITYSIPLTDRTRAIVSVRVTLNYQAIPPYYLKDRFTIGKGAETQRLAYLTSHLSLSGTPIENWKLTVACGSRRLEDQTSQPCQRW
ncbi:MAG TPA: cytochrome P460 family protein [Pyrinomonadaceae bacterium]|nr:cytochrome P460 family protein [Pyrinomonadaceae bacterium]